MAFLPQMEELAAELHEDGFLVSTPAPDEEGTNWSDLTLEQAVALKKDFLDAYFEVIRNADAVLIANYPKHGIKGYIGANALMEAACGHALGKPVIFLHEIGEQPCRLEALSISSGILNGSADGLKELIG